MKKCFERSKHCSMAMLDGNKKTKILFFDNFSQSELKITQLTFKHHFDGQNIILWPYWMGKKRQNFFFSTICFSSQFGLKITKSTSKHHSLGENVVLGPYWVKLKKKEKKKIFLSIFQCVDHFVVDHFKSSILTILALYV